MVVPPAASPHSEFTIRLEYARKHHGRTPGIFSRTR